jgi:hypothetical protein
LAVVGGRRVPEGRPLSVADEELIGNLPHRANPAGSNFREPLRLLYAQNQSRGKASAGVTLRTGAAEIF